MPAKYSLIEYRLLKRRPHLQKNDAKSYAITHEANDADCLKLKAFRSDMFAESKLFRFVNINQ